VAVNQARKEVDVRARKGDDVPYLMTAGDHAKGLNGAGWRRVPKALGELELPRRLHVAHPTVLSYSYDRMMGDDRSCLWDMYVVERVQLTAIALLADLAGGRVHRISPALIHRLGRLRLDDMAEGSADEHARLQRLLQGMAVLLPKWGDVVLAAGLPLGQTPLPAEADDAANPHGFQLALHAKGVDFPSRAERATSRSSTARGRRGRPGTRGRGTPGAEASTRPGRTRRRQARDRRLGGPCRRRGRRRGGVPGTTPSGCGRGPHRRRRRQREGGRPVGGRHVGQRGRAGKRRLIGRGRGRADRGHQRPRRDARGHRGRDAGRHAIGAGRRLDGQRRRQRRRIGVARRRWGNPRVAASGRGHRQRCRHVGGSRRRPPVRQGGRTAARQRPDRATRGAAGRRPVPMERPGRRLGQPGRGGAGGPRGGNARGRPRGRRWSPPTRRTTSGTAWGPSRRKATRSGRTCRRRP